MVLKSPTDMNLTDSKSGLTTRQLTPPDSPHSPAPLHTVPSGGTNKAGKMSLDFIAPGSRSQSPEPVPTIVKPTLPGLECLSAAASLHRGSRPSTPSVRLLVSTSFPSISTNSILNTPFNTPEQAVFRPNECRPRLMDYPSPTWSNCSDLPLDKPVSKLHHYNQTFRLPSIKPIQPIQHYTHPKSRAFTSLPSPPRTHPNRVTKRTHQQNTRNLPIDHTSARAERFPYDPEERYAIIHLRGLKNLKYEDTLARFNVLFPPGMPRRCRAAVAKGLPPTYTQRNVQGLQCRWYRIRDEENLPKLRSSGHGGDRGRVEEVLALVEREGGMGRGFSGFVDQVAEMGNESLERMLL